MDNNYNGPMTVGTSAAPVRESETSRAFSKLYSTIDTISKQFGDLDVRLSPILRAEVPAEVADQKEPGYSSQLAQEINAATQKLLNLSRYISSIRNRVEL